MMMTSTPTTTICSSTMSFRTSSWRPHCQPRKRTMTTTTPASCCRHARPTPTPTIRYDQAPMSMSMNYSKKKHRVKSINTQMIERRIRSLIFATTAEFRRRRFARAARRYRLRDVDLRATQQQRCIFWQLFALVLRICNIVACLLQILRALIIISV